MLHIGYIVRRGFDRSTKLAPDKKNLRPHSNGLQLFLKPITSGPPLM